MTRSPLPISATIIGYNEEEKIEDCLKSLKGLVSEIVYVDSHSTDRTVEIVKEYTSNIYYKKFEGYTEQKNFAQEKTTHEWVLNLDCDERLSDEAREEILSKWKTIESSKEISGISFPRLTFYLTRFIRHGGWYPDRKIRLIKKSKCQWEGDRLHEEMKCSEGKVLAFKGDILHYSFDTVDDHLDTIRKFSELGARDLFERGRTANLFVIVARSFWAGFRKLFLEFSFLDGTAGIIMTGLSVTATWCKYSKLYLLCKKAKKEIS